jgi:hypothetical protein
MSVRSNSECETQQKYGSYQNVKELIIGVVKGIMSKNRDNTKKYAQLHGIVSEMHQLENRLYEMLEAWDFKNSNDYWRLADQFHDLNTQFSKSVLKEHQDR